MRQSALREPEASIYAMLVEGCRLHRLYLDVPGCGTWEPHAPIGAAFALICVTAEKTSFTVSLRLSPDVGSRAATDFLAWIGSQPHVRMQTSASRAAYYQYQDADSLDLSGLVAALDATESQTGAVDKALGRGLITPQTAAVTLADLLRDVQ